MFLKIPCTIGSAPNRVDGLNVAAPTGLLPPNSPGFWTPPGAGGVQWRGRSPACSRFKEPHVSGELTLHGDENQECQKDQPKHDAVLGNAHAGGRGERGAERDHGFSLCGLRSPDERLQYRGPEGASSNSPAVASLKALATDFLTLAVTGTHGSLRAGRSLFQRA